MTLNNTIEVILSHLDFDGDTCCEWPRARDQKGYGLASLNGKTRRVHRLVAEHFIGDIGGKVVMHTCDNPPCCNPKHLKITTQVENINDMYSKGRSPQCGDTHHSAILKKKRVTNGEG